MPRRLEVTSVLGEVTIDTFTEAIVRDREIVVQVAVVLGSVTLVVPEGIDVRMDAAYLLGDRKVRLTGPVTPGGPVYWVRGFVVLGEITVAAPTAPVDLRSALIATTRRQRTACRDSR